MGCSASRALLVAVSLGALTTSVEAAPPVGFDQRVEQLRTEFGAPGVTVAIVENGQATLAKGWGTQLLGTQQTVGPRTIFATGSTGKAFTVAALAILVDQGKI